MNLFKLIFLKRIEEKSCIKIDFLTIFRNEETLEKSKYLQCKVHINFSNN